MLLRASGILHDVMFSCGPSEYSSTGIATASRRSSSAGHVSPGCTLLAIPTYTLLSCHALRRIDQTLQTITTKPGSCEMRGNFSTDMPHPGTSEVHSNRTWMQHPSMKRKRFPHYPRGKFPLAASCLEACWLARRAATQKTLGLGPQWESGNFT